MERYGRGAADCFEPLFKRHSGRVYGFLFRHTGDRALSEDLFQQTWLKVHRARASYRPGEPFAPWLYTIANNCRRDAARGRARAKEDLTGDGSLPDTPAPIAAGDEGDRVRAALAALPERTREIIIMHRWLDLSFAEIAKVLGDGTSEGAIKVRAHRGYLALRDLLQTPSVAEAKQGASR